MLILNNDQGDTMAGRRIPLRSAARTDDRHIYRGQQDADGRLTPPAWIKILPQQRQFWRGYKPPLRFDVREQFDGFETLDEMVAERNARVASLGKGDQRSWELGKFLAAFGDKESAGITACPITVREFRIWAIAQMMKMFDPYDDIFELHLFFPEDDVPFGQLHRLDWQKIGNRERRRFERQVSPGVLVIGFKEVDPDYNNQIWRAHMHVFAVDCTAVGLERLRRSHFSPRNGRTGLMLIDDLVVDRMRQMAYAAKVTAYRKFTKRSGPTPPQRVRLREPEHREYLKYLARHSPTDLMFMMGAERLNRIEIRRTPAPQRPQAGRQSQRQRTSGSTISRDEWRTRAADFRKRLAAGLLGR
jgi:hypothetical protein